VKSLCQKGGIKKGKRGVSTGTQVK